MDDDKPHIVLDIGSDFVKAGFAGEDGPRAIFPCIIGRPKMPGVMVGFDQRDYFVGMETIEKRGVLILRKPVVHGTVVDWEDMEHILDYIFNNELRVDPSEHNVIVTQPPLNPTSDAEYTQQRLDREKLISILFETFNVPNVALVNSAECTLHAYGYTSGIVVDSGDEVTNIVPIVDGHAITRLTKNTNLAGRDLTNYMKSLLTEQHLCFSSPSEMEILKDIKEQTCYVALDFQQELSDSAQGMTKTMDYTLPEGNTITIGNERFRTTEILFNPLMGGKELRGIQEQIYLAITEADAILWPQLGQHIVLSGGSMSFPGFAERLEAELKNKLPVAVAQDMTIVTMPWMKYAAWIGGASLSNTEAFADRWVTTEEYRDTDTGPAIIHQKYGE